VWAYFSTCVTKNANAFTANAGVFGKVYFPRLTTPISNVLSAVIQFGVQMVMVLIFLVYYLIRGEVTVMLLRWLWIPLVLLHLGLLGMGFGIIVSSLTTKYRDLSVLVGFGVQLWMYATPVVYPISEITEGWMRAIIMINPVTPSVELLRYAMLGQGTVNWTYYGLSWLMTIAIAFLGIIIFNKVEKTFMDTV
jgi:lipopolysaccharide transport system permease protein